MEFEKTNKINLLLDFYGELLTKKRKETMELYFKEDFSLSEIADILQITKSGVHDSIEKSITKLEDYEKKLKILQRHVEKSKLLNEWESLSKESIKELIDKNL